MISTSILGESRKRKKTVMRYHKSVHFFSLMNITFLHLLQNLRHDGDDESENGLKVSKEERKTYLAERAEKKKAQQRAYSLEYNKRPEVVARRKASREQYNKNKRQRDTIVESASLSQDNHGFNEVS